jgi:hypothetical protein
MSSSSTQQAHITPPVQAQPSHVHARKSNVPPLKYMAPLIFAPIIPLLRLSLRNKPKLRDAAFGVRRKRG